MKRMTAVTKRNRHECCDMKHTHTHTLSQAVLKGDYGVLLCSSWPQLAGLGDGSELDPSGQLQPSQYVQVKYNFF